MPVRIVYNNQKEKVQEYKWMLGFTDGDGGMSPIYTIKEPTLLRKWRAEYATYQQEFVTFQKYFASERDIETAKFFKEEGRRMLKHVRACTLILDEIEGNATTKYRHWPVDLADELDWISSRVYLHHMEDSEEIKEPVREEDIRPVKEGEGTVQV